MKNEQIIMTRVRSENMDSLLVRAGFVPESCSWRHIANKLIRGRHPVTILVTGKDRKTLKTRTVEINLK